MSKNLVMGLAFGYSLDKIKPFVLSLRQYYQDDIIFILSEPSDEVAKFLADNDVISYVPDEPLQKNTCQIMRYNIYHDCLTDYFEDTDNVLIADVRDIIFQSDPFTNYPKYSLEFFAEPEIFKNCRHNTPWITAIYGADRVNQISDEYVLCSGTTMGTRKGILKYCESMITEINRLADECGRQVFGGEDQPIHNHVVYNNLFDDYRINHNGTGPISTMHHAQELLFNRQGYLLNDDGSVIPAVHQYDRLGAFSLVFLKNALKVKGAKGIEEVSTYAVNNFFDHDL